MTCDETPRVEALLDGELDAAAAAAVERHLAGCPACRAARGELEALRRRIRTEATRHVPGAALAARLAARLDALEPPRAAPVPRRWPRPWQRPGFWSGAASGGLAAAAVTAALLLGSGVPRETAAPVENDVLAAHLRSLVPDHLIDVASSDRHTVKPWFAGRVDVSPPVADFVADGYPLVGGRADFVAGRRAAAVVYRHGAHVINVFSWPAATAATSAPRVTSRNGYHFVAWQDGTLAFCAVSDVAPADLLALAQRLRAVDATARE